MIAILNSQNLSRNLSSKIHRIKVINFYETQTEKLIIENLKTNRTEPLIIDAELKLISKSKFQNYEGIKLAYIIRTEPNLKYLGEIFLLGFSSLEDIMKNSYSAVVKGSNKVSYLRYPTDFSLNETLPFSELEWEKCVDTLDYNFISEFRKFEHSFRNLRILKSDTINDKLEEISSHFNTFLQIGKENHVSSRFSGDYRIIKENFTTLVNYFKTDDRKLIIEELMNLKNQIANFKTKYTNKYK